jgi:hypothetical protein
MDGAKILNNTSVAPWWANGIRIAGGKNVVVTNNLVNSVSANNALDIGVFGDTGQPLESAIVDGNVLIGGGGWNGTDRHGVHVGSPSITSLFPSAYTVATISNNNIRDSLRAGLKIGTRNENLTITDNTIDHPATQGIWDLFGSGWYRDVCEQYCIESALGPSRVPERLSEHLYSGQQDPTDAHRSGRPDR